MGVALSAYQVKYDVNLTHRSFISMRHSTSIDVRPDSRPGQSDRVACKAATDLLLAPTYQTAALRAADLNNRHLHTQWVLTRLSHGLYAECLFHTPIDRSD